MEGRTVSEGNEIHILKMDPPVFRIALVAMVYVSGKENPKKPQVFSQKKGLPKYYKVIKIYKYK